MPCTGTSSVEHTIFHYSKWTPSAFTLAFNRLCGSHKFHEIAVQKLLYWECTEICKTTCANAVIEKFTIIQNYLRSSHVAHAGNVYSEML